MHFLLMRDQGPTPLNDCPTLPCPRLACTSFTPEPVDALHAALAGLIIAMTSAAFSDQLALSIATKRIDYWATGLLGYWAIITGALVTKDSIVPLCLVIVVLSLSPSSITYIISSHSFYRPHKKPSPPIHISPASSLHCTAPI